MKLDQLIKDMEAMAERLPCACGCRPTSEPQTYVPGSYSSATGKGPGKDMVTVRHRCMMTCGVCKQDHPVMKMDYVDTRELAHV